MQKHRREFVCRAVTILSRHILLYIPPHVLGRCTILQFTMPMKNIIILYTTVAQIEDARKIAQVLLDLRLIACAQIDGPIESIYRWKESVETSKEYRLSVKSTKDRATQVMETIQKHHPYEVAEIVGQSQEYCSTEYQNWIVEEVNNVSA